jgi:segregation and condensation protein A
MEEALGHLRKFLNFSGDWMELSSYLPEGWVADPKRLEAQRPPHLQHALNLQR